MDAAPAPWRRRVATNLGCVARLAGLLCAIALTEVPAAAQFAGNLSVFSQSRFRGRAVSDHRPAMEVELVHDEDNGLYLGGVAAAVVTRDEGLKPLSVKGYAGFARRLPSGPVIDIGVVHGHYTDYSGIPGSGSYSEAHLGVIGRNISGRIYVSPAYFHAHQPTLYMETDGHLPLDQDWSLLGHLGVLAYLRDRPDGQARTAMDWRIGARRRLGSFDLEAAWTGYRERKPYYRAYGRGRDDALMAVLTFSF